MLSDVSIHSIPSNVRINSMPSDVSIHSMPSDVIIHSMPSEVSIHYMPSDVSIHSIPSDVSIHFMPCRPLPPIPLRSGQNFMKDAKSAEINEFLLFELRSFILKKVNFR